MANTGTIYPGTARQNPIAPYDDFAWNNVTYITADDTNYASITDNAYDSGQQSYMIAAQNYGSTVPSDGTVLGVIVEIGKYYAVGAARDGTVQLINGTASPIGTSKGSTGTNWPTSAPGTITYGGSSDLWGAELTPAIVNGANFGVQFAGSAAGANCDSYVDFIRMVIYYNAPVTQWDITVAENNQAQVSDLTTLGVWHPITAADNVQAQKTDLASLGVWTPLTAAENNQAQVSDAAIPGVLTPVTVAECNQAQASDAVTFDSIVHPITAAENNQAQVFDDIALGVTTPLTAAENNQAQVSDAADLSIAALQITAEDNNQAQVSDDVTLGVWSPITAEDNTQAQVSDDASLGVWTPITAEDGNQAQVTDAVTISAYYPITVAECNQSQVSDEAILTAGEATISIAENRQAQVSDDVGITFSGLVETNVTASDMFQAQAVDLPGLGVVYVINLDDNFQAQVSDLASLSILTGAIEGERDLYTFGVRGSSVFAARGSSVFATRSDLEVND